MNMEWLKPEIIFGSVLYAVIGIVVLGIFFIVVDKLTPYHLWDRDRREEERRRSPSCSARCASRSA